MKKITITLIALLGFIATSCDVNPLKNAADDFQLIIQLESVNTSASVMLYDANSGEIITDEVTVTFEPITDGVRVIDFYSDTYEEATVQNGVLLFGIGNEFEPNDDQPAYVRVRYSAPGYKDFTQRLRLDGTGSTPFQARMINESNPPEGVAFSNSDAGETGEDGAVSEPVTISSGGSSLMGVMNGDDTDFSISFPAGTKFYDADGNLLTGRLRARTETYDTSFPRAFNGLPPVFKEYAENENALIYNSNGYRITDENGRQMAYVQYPEQESSENALMNQHLIHFASITALSSIYSNGTFVDDMNFIMSNIVQTTDQSATDLILGYVKLNTVKEYGLLEVIDDGDYIRIDFFISMEPCPQDVQQIQYGSLCRFYSTSVANTPIPVDHEVPDHLVHADVPDFGVSQVYPDELCSSTLTVDRNGVEGDLTVSVSVAGSFREFTLQAGKSQIPDINLSNNKEHTIKVSDNVFPGAKANHEFCNAPNLTIKMPAPPANIITANVTVAVQCADKSKKVRVKDIPMPAVKYREQESKGDFQTASDLKFIYDKDSKALVRGTFKMSNAKLNTTYDMRFHYSNNVEKSVITVGGSSDVTHTEIINDGSVCN